MIQNAFDIGMPWLKAPNLDLFEKYQFELLFQLIFAIHFMLCDLLQAKKTRAEIINSWSRIQCVWNPTIIQVKERQTEIVQDLVLRGGWQRLWRKEKYNDSFPVKVWMKKE